VSEEAGGASPVPALESPLYLLPLSLAGRPTELGRKGEEMSFFKFEALQAGHTGRQSLRPGRWSTSKTFAQDSHLYSNIGIVHLLILFQIEPDLFSTLLMKIPACNRAGN